MASPTIYQLTCPDGCGVTIGSTDPGSVAGHKCRKTGKWGPMVKAQKARKK